MGKRGTWYVLHQKDGVTIIDPDGAEAFYKEDEIPLMLPNHTLDTVSVQYAPGAPYRRCPIHDGRTL